MAETQSQPPTPSLIQKLQTSDLAQKVEKAIPLSVSQAVAEKVERVKRVSPEIEKEARVWYEGFRLKVIHLTFLGYFLATFLWRLFHLGTFSFGFNFLFLTGKNLFLWLSGGILGWNLVILDYLVYVYFVGGEYSDVTSEMKPPQKTDEPRRFFRNSGGGRHFTHPETALIEQAKNLLAQRKLSQAIRFLESKNLHLSFRGVLFRLVWVGLALFALTSTTSLFGKGLVMGLGLHLLLAEWQGQRTNPQVLNACLFWQIKRKVSLNEQKWYLWTMTGIFAVLSLLV